MSMKRSTQFARHVSSPLSSLPFLNVPVTHFLKHVSVRSCDSVRGNDWLAKGNNDTRRVVRMAVREAVSHTGLDAGALLLVLDELAQVLLVLVGEPVEVGLVDRRGVHGFFGWLLSLVACCSWLVAERRGAVAELGGC